MSHDAPPPTVTLPADRIARNLRLHSAASSGDLPLCLSLLDAGADAWYQDPSSHGWSALHYAAQSGHSNLIRLLLCRGAIWNAVDALGLTAAEVACSMNWEKCYRTLFDEGVRRSMLESLLARNNHNHNNDDDDDEVDAAQHYHDHEGRVEGTEQSMTLHAPTHDEVSTSNTAFLSSRLRFFADSNGKMRCLDQDGGMVMADWESDIMRLSAHLVCSPHPPGFSVLNVGFGLGIVDTFIQRYKPARHVIIEPHPDAIAYMKSKRWHEIPGVEIFRGKWEDWITDDESQEAQEKRLQLGSFDAVYWDTYSQNYSELQTFFNCLPHILNGADSRFSFFHGLAATNPFFYDVYTRLSELHLKEVGLHTEWHPIVPECPQEEWQGVLRKYWTLETYNCPVARFELL